MKTKQLRRFIAPAIVLVAAFVLIASVYIGWLGSSRLTAINPQSINYDHTVIAIDGNNITLRGGTYSSLGLMGAVRPDGSTVGILGRPIASNPNDQTAVRQFTTTPLSALRVGEQLSLQGNIWTSNPKNALGLDYSTVTYTSNAGTLNAWKIPGSEATTWTIGVHGIGADKTEMLRFIKPVIASGSTMLVINYRNDPGNPLSADMRNNLGYTEWRDVSAAVQYAQSQGAQRVYLYGNSLGGSLVQNYLRRADDTAIVKKVILDSPALDWPAILKNQAKKGGYPPIVYYPTAAVLWARTGISTHAISTKASDINKPTLIIHSSDDPTVPQAASKHIAHKRPDMVTFLDFNTGGHLRSWNADQSRYEAAVTSFLQRR